MEAEDPIPMTVSQHNEALPDGGQSKNKSSVVVQSGIDANYMRKIFIASSVIFCGLTFLILIISITLYFLTQVIKYPDIVILGNITGNVSASLGALGPVQLSPDLQIAVWYVGRIPRITCMLFNFKKLGKAFQDPGCNIPNILKTIARESKCMYHQHYNALVHDLIRSTVNCDVQLCQQRHFIKKCQ